MVILIKNSLVGNNKNILNYDKYLNYEIDFDNSDFIKLFSILNQVKNYKGSHSINDTSVKNNILEGSEIRKLPQFINSLNTYIDKTNQNLLDEFKTILTNIQQVFTLSNEYKDVEFHPGVKYQKYKKLNTTTVTRYECSNCKKTYLEKKSLVRHIKETEVCKSANATTIQKEFAPGTVEVFDVLEIDKKFKYSKCSTKFTKKTHVARHIKNVTKCKDATIVILK